MPKQTGGSASTPVDDAEQMRAILEEYLRPPNHGPLRIENCRVIDRRHRDGVRGTTQFEVQVTDPQSGITGRRLVTGMTLGAIRTRRLWEAARQTAPTVAVGAGPALLPFSYVPELDLLLQVFPHDHRLPALARFVEGPGPGVETALMGEFGPGDWRLESLKAEAIRYRPDMRAIVRLDLAAVDTSSDQQVTRQFFAKIYRDSADAQRAFHAQRELHDHVRANGAKLTIAKPIALNEALNSVVTTAIPGVTLEKIVRKGANVDCALAAAARAVAALHQVRVAAPARSAADEIAGLQQAGEALISVRPDLRPVVLDIVATVTAGLESPPEGLIHGDLKPEHILIDGDNVGLIDFDLYATADPMMDVAHLLAFLHRSEQRSSREFGDDNEAASAFLDEYFSCMPEALRPRIRLYYAMSSVHKAVGLSRKGGRDQDDLVASVLSEGQAYLNENAGDARAPSFKRRLTKSAAR